MDIPILFEDDVLLICDKPPGVVVNRAQSVTGETVQDWVERHNPNASWTKGIPGDDFYSRSGVVHRIDKETSGILVVAKTPESFIEMQRQFKERIVKKTYLALVHGNLVPEDGEIHAPVGRLPWNRKHFGILPGGKDAVTTYHTLSSGQTTEDEHVSLVELHPKTGRTHQIRVHLKYVGHPILGDPLYAGRKVGRNDRLSVPRVMLHAWKLTIVHPVSGKPLAFSSPIPDDMNRLISQVQNRS